MYHFCWATFAYTYMCVFTHTHAKAHAYIYIYIYIYSQLDIKLGPFIREEFNVVLTKIKSEKATALEEMPPEFKESSLQCTTIYL